MLFLFYFCYLTLILFVMTVFDFNKMRKGGVGNFASNYDIYHQAFELMILFFYFNYLIFNGKKI
ncbi:hypothetical protein KU73_21325 [Pectobacterium wasabiae]|uniref:Uncharacterized protein n=1 Tax=Pectobacterium wasabiae TaxID=55208 RepID=A0AAW3EBS2_9GAMM|nr:hypothetical protein A7983_02200 [Pectobacterium wasabiae CFBP 3304]KFX02814.1 hypothetical protein JV38_20725 [Pectobacterium wasabiae]KGA26411.1 hypothetical protein KU73_21325 [Pectobacterium wasabiae]